MFNEEIRICSSTKYDHAVVPDKFKLLQPDISMVLDIHKHYLKRLYGMLINASDWLGDCDTQFEIPAKYQISKNVT